MGGKVLYLAVGVILAVLGYFSMKKGNEKQRKCTAMSSGLLVSVDESRSSGKDGSNDDEYSYTPIYAYSVNNVTYNVKGASSSDGRKYKVGDTANVYYDPKDPKTSYIKGASGLGGGLIFCIIGIIITILALVNLTK